MFRIQRFEVPCRITSTVSKKTIQQTAEEYISQVRNGRWYLLGNDVFTIGLYSLH